MEEKKKKPEIRFDGYTHAWEQRELGNIVERVTRKNSNKESDLPLTISAQYGLVDQYTYFNNRVASKDLSNYYLVLNGEFAYNKSTSDGYPYGAIKRLDNYENGVLSTLYIVFKLRNEIKNNLISSDFLSRFFETDRWHKTIEENAAEGARNHGLLNISVEDFFTTPISCPTDIQEQIKIAKFLDDISNNITLHQRECLKLQNFKKSMLEKMFPENGEKVPEVRFAGYTDSWEQVNIGGLMDVTSVKRIHQSDWREKGIRFLRARDIVAAFKNTKPDDYLYISEEKYEEYSAISGKVNINDLLVTGVGTIGVPYLIETAEPLYFKDGNVIWFKNNNRINGNFFYYSFIGKNIQDYITESAGTGTVGTYTIESGKNTPIFLPEKSEQEEIGTFFKDLDVSIDLHQREVTKLKQIKKALLDKMFV